MDTMLQDLYADEMMEIALASFSEDVIRDFLLAASKRPRMSSKATLGEPIRLYSSGAVGNANRLKLSAMQADVKSAFRTTVVSAYFAPSTLERLLNGGGDVRFITNGLGGRRLEEQVEQLSHLESKLVKQNAGAEVRLAFSDGIFHTKLYLFEQGEHLVAWVGSANATAAALGGHNEEILTRLEPAPVSFLAYAEGVWGESWSLDDCRPEVSSLESFYKTGDIYYRPYAHLRVSVNPFRPLLHRLPPEERTKLARFQSDYAETDAGVGAFNARLVYRGNDGFLDLPTKPARIRPYAIETCYGYWVPRQFVDHVEGTLNRSSETKMRFLSDFREWINGEGCEKTVEAYKTYLGDAKRAMVESDVDLGQYVEEFRHVFENEDPAKRCISEIQEQLRSDVDIEKHSRAFVAGRLPEVWDDAAARDHFEGTFFEALEAESEKPARLWPAAGWILRGIGISGSTSAKEIKQELDRCLGMSGWFESNL